MDKKSDEKPKKRAVSPINGQPVPGGRPKGVPNKSTTAAREAIARFVDGNADRLQEWLDKIAVKDPEAAFKLFNSVIEYHVPKLNRNTVVGDPDNPVDINYNISSTDKEILERYQKQQSKKEEPTK